MSAEALRPGDVPGGGKKLAAPMTWVDYAILGILGLSSVLGLLRGFVRELLSLVAFAAAVWVAMWYGDWFSGYLEPYIEPAPLRQAASYALVFVIALILCGLVGALLARLIASAGLSAMDRVAGLLFGCAKGALLVAVLVLLAKATPMPEQAWWQASQFLPGFEVVAHWLRDRLPERVAGYLKYH